MSVFVPDTRLIKSPDVTDKATWPKSQSRFVFIFEAINLVGEALHLKTWSGNEIAVVEWPLSPVVRRENEKKPRPLTVQEYNRRHKPQPRRYQEHVLDFKAAQLEPIWEENKQATSRLLDCVEWLAQRCRDGELTPFARPSSGGEVMPVEANEWNIDDPLQHFVVKGGSRRRFVHNGYATPLMDSFAFFDRENLREVLGRQPDAPLIVGHADLSRLSPYVRLAVHVALERQYFAGSVIDAAPTREAEVEAAWQRFLPDVPMTDAGVRQIAKLIGFPDPEAIKQGQRGGRSNKTAATRKG
jgi:hypothetical protein